MLIVKKFGGTSVANKERIYNVANRCVEEYKKGNDVVVVLSAMGKYTDELIQVFRESTNMTTIQRLEGAVLIRQPLHWQQLFMQTHVRSTRMWMEFILLIREKCRMHAN